MNFKESFAFTLIELMISVSIIIILTAISIPVFTSLSSNQSLTQNAENVKADTRIIQSKALAGVITGTNGRWGMSFNCQIIDGRNVAISYNLGQPQDPQVDDSPVVTQLTKNLSTGIEINCGGLTQLVFERLTGETVSGLDQSITISDLHGNTRTINVSHEGVIELQ